MENASSNRQSTPGDYAKIKEIIDLSFPRFFLYFANHSVTSKDGKVLVSETQGRISGFIKLIEFKNWLAKIWLRSLDCNSSFVPA